MDFNTQPFTVREVSKKLRVDTEVVYRLLNDGKLVGYKPGGEWRIWPADLAAYLETRRHKAVQVRTIREIRRSEKETDEILARHGLNWN